MRKKKFTRKFVAEEMPREAIEKHLQKVGRLIHAKRKARGPLEGFAYEIGISRSAMTRYEAGGDMYFSTFLKVIYGLDTTPEEFFKELK